MYDLEGAWERGRRARSPLAPPPPGTASSASAQQGSICTWAGRTKVGNPELKSYEHCHAKYFSDGGVENMATQHLWGFERRSPWVVTNPAHLKNRDPDPTSILVGWAFFWGFPRRTTRIATCEWHNMKTCHYSLPGWGNNWIVLTKLAGLFFFIKGSSLQCEERSLFL